MGDRQYSSKDSVLQILGDLVKGQNETKEVMIVTNNKALIFSSSYWDHDGFIFIHDMLDLVDLMEMIGIM